METMLRALLVEQIWMGTTTSRSRVCARPGNAAGVTDPADERPSIFTALQEQLRLTLRSERAPVDVLVIDRLERPTSN
jgi:uncharacterized protein (TIGR03435 family)